MIILFSDASMVQVYSRNDAELFISDVQEILCNVDESRVRSTSTGE